MSGYKCRGRHCLKLCFVSRGAFRIFQKLLAQKLIQIVSTELISDVEALMFYCLHTLLGVS